MRGSVSAPRGSDRAGGLELVDQPRRVSQRQVLGAADPEVVAEQPGEVGPLPPRDRDDRPDLVRGRRLAGPGPGYDTTGRGPVRGAGPFVVATLPVDRRGAVFPVRCGQGQ